MYNLTSFADHRQKPDGPKREPVHRFSHRKSSIILRIYANYFGGEFCDGLGKAISARRVRM